MWIFVLVNWRYLVFVIISHWVSCLSLRCLPLIVGTSTILRRRSRLLYFGGLTMTTDIGSRVCTTGCRKVTVGAFILIGFGISIVGNLIILHWAPLVPLPLFCFSVGASITLCRTFGVLRFGGLVMTTAIRYSVCTTRRRKDTFGSFILTRSSSFIVRIRATNTFIHA